MGGGGRESSLDNNWAEILISIQKTPPNSSCFPHVAWDMHLTFLFILSGPPSAEIPKYIFSFLG